MTDIFLSYSRDDQAIARKFAEAFEREGLSVWWDQTLKAGEAYDRVTERALQDAKAVVVLWSRNSVESHWVRSEATQAQANGTLVPVMIEACKRPIMFELMHTAELAHWKGDATDQAWRTFLGDVRQFAKKERAATSPAASSVVPRKGKFGVGALAGIVAAVLVASGLGLWAVKHRSDNHPKEVTLAVLPFANLSSDPEQEYFSDGLTEEILDQLAQIKDLVLTGRTSSFSFKGKNEDLRVIAEKLGVANLLEGSIRKNGSQLRITAQLINGKAGTHLWSRTYERELKDAFAVQEEIAKDVARALSVKLDVGEMTLAKGGTTNIEAHDKYLQALALQNQDGGSEATNKAADLLREAVVLDPQFLGAWRLLSRALNGLTFFSPENEVDLRREIAAADNRLIALTPDGRGAQFQRWSELMKQRDWAEAERAARTFDRSFGEPGPLNGVLAAVGRFKETMPGLERRVRQDPLSLATSTDLQLVLTIVGRREEADVEFERGRQLAGTHDRAEFIAMWRLLGSKDQSRVADQERFRETMTGNKVPLAIDATLAEKLNDNTAASALVRKAFEDTVNQQPLRMVLIAMYAGVFSDRELVLAALRRSIFDLHGEVSNVWMPYESGLRADRRFKDLVRDLGIVDYWRTTGNWGDFCKPVGKDDFECH